MLVHLSIHRPRTGKERDLVESMYRFGRGDGEPFAGLREALTLRDRETGTLVGITIWESEEDFRAGVPRMRVAVEGDDFASWEDAPPAVYLLDPA